MHELSIASGIVEKVLGFAEEQQLAQVLAVRVAVGELSHLEGEQLRFCYGAITKETAIEGSTLEIENIEAAVKCPHCSYEGRPKYWDGALVFVSVPTLECPNCGKAAEATQGHECAIKTIRFVR
jgi:hydrogenase nickel incorporation protein HypA/HybF